MPLSGVLPTVPAVDSSEILRVSIDGEWETQEFGEFLRCVTFLYRVSAAESFVRDDLQASDFNTEEAQESLLELSENGKLVKVEKLESKSP